MGNSALIFSCRGIGSWCMYMIFFVLLASGLFSQEAGELRVISFNIRYDNPDDKPNDWQSRKGLVCNVISDYQPDIAGLQEVLHNQLNNILEALPDYDHIGVGRLDGMEKGEYAPILYLKDKFTMLENGHYWLSASPHVAGSKGWDAACERIVTWAILENKQDGKRCFVCNTHFDHVGGTARLNSARMIKDSLREQAAGLPVILTGDFNTSPGTAPYDEILVYGLPLRDSRVAHSSGESELPTFTGFDKNPENDALIDFIFVSKEYTVKDYRAIGNVSGEIFVSDHKPVFIIIN